MADYNEIAKRLRAEQDQSVGAALYNAADVNPDREGVLTQLSRRTGIPVTSLRVKDLEQDALRLDTANKYEAIAQNAPNLASWLTADQQNANLAHDDTDNMGAIERVVRDVGVTAVKGAVGLPQAFVGLADIPTGGRVGKALEDIGFRFEDAQKILETAFSPQQQAANRAVSQAEGFLDTLAEAAQNPSAVAVTIGESLPQMLGGAGIARGLMSAGARTVGAGMAGPALPGLLARTLGERGAAVAAGAIGEGTLAAGAAAEQIRGQTQDRLLTPGQSALALSSGVLTAALGLAGGKLAERLGLTDVDTLLARGLDDATLQTARTNLAARLAAGGISEGLFEELPQSAQEQMLQNIALDKPILDGVANAAAMGFLAGAVTGGFASGIVEGARMGAERARNAEQDKRALEQLDKLAAASKVRQRDVDTFESFVAEASKDAPVQDVYIDAKTLMQSGVAGELATVSPSVAEQLPNAVATGGTVRIPVAEYTARIAGTELNQALLDNLRTTPDGFSQNEAREFLQSYQEELQRDVEQALNTRQGDDAFRASAKAVEDMVFNELESAGRFKSDVNRAYATLQSAFASTMASKLGITPEEFFRQHLLRVVSQQTGGQQFAQVDNGDVQVTDQIDELTGLPLNTDGTVTVYHHTSAANAEAIRRSGVLRSAGEPDVYLTTRDVPDTGYGDTVVKVRIDPAKLQIDDEFPDGRMDFRVNVGRPGGALRDAQFNQEINTPDFKAWFGDSKVVDENGQPLRVYRGEYGATADAGLQTKLGTYTFTNDPDVASTYAQDPNDMRMTAEAPRVVPAFLSMQNPIINNPDDPFAELGDIADKLGLDNAVRFAIKNDEAITETDNWYENFADNYDSVEQLLEENPEAVRQLYVDSFRLLDDLEFVQAAKDAGYDGAIHMGNGESFDTTEYRVFDASQVRSSMRPGELFQSAKKKKAPEPPEQPRGRVVPSSVSQAANVESAFAFAGSKQFSTNRDFKIELQALVNQAAKAARVDLTEFSKGTEDYLVQLALADGQTALRTNANAVGWYNEKVTKALQLVALMHPEIMTDPQAKFAFVWAMAVTSNGLKVDKNFELAEQAYQAYKADKKMPNDIGIGTASAAINKSLDLFNVLIEKHGFEKVEKFMTTFQTVKEVEKFTGQDVSGEFADTLVYGAAALGPKIGNGFFMNLYGRFEQLTMDRWLMRTWGRWTGTLVVPRPDKVKEKRAQLRSLIEFMTPADKKAFESVIKTKLKLTDLDGVAAAINKASEKKKNRTAMAQVALLDDAGQANLINLLGKPKKNATRVSYGDELRKVGNALVKYIDGQKEAPDGPAERGDIRKVFSRALQELQKTYPALTMSDFQALLWYPEKRLYDAAKVANEDADSGYQDDEAPDYANAAAKLARANGISDAEITAALAAVDERLQAAVSPGGVRPGERGSGDRRPGQEQEGVDSLNELYQSPSRIGLSFKDVIKRTPELQAAAEKVKAGEMTAAEYSALVDQYKPVEAYAEVPAPASTEDMQGALTSDKVERIGVPSSTLEAGHPVGLRLDIPAYANHGVWVVSVHEQQAGFNAGKSIGYESVAAATNVTFGVVEKAALNIASGKPKATIAVMKGDWKPTTPETAKTDADAALNDSAWVQVGMDPERHAYFYDRATMQPILSADEVIQIGPLVLAKNAQYGNAEDFLFQGAQEMAQPARGSFNPATNTIALLKAADLSTFLHESGHFFLETQFAVAAQLAQESRMFGTDTNTAGQQQIIDDTNAVLRWFGLNGLDEWYTLDFEEQRAYHEKFAESFEAYLFSGEAPSIELQGAFQRFRAWLVNVYKSLTKFIAGNPAAGELNDEIRQVMDRMLATNEQIALAEQARSMMPLFTTPDQAGMTVDEFAAYQALGRDATAAAQEDLQAKSLRDLQWYSRAKQREIRKLKKRAAQLRSEVRMEARREIMSQPIYMAWQFLTNKLQPDDRITPKAPPKSDPNRVQPEMDSLFTAIAKLGGLNRAEVEDTWGWDQKVPVPVFGKPVLRREGGKTIDHMGEALAELGYLSVDKNGKHDVAELEEKFDDERRGNLRYSVDVDPALILPDETRAGEGLNLEGLGAGRIDVGELRAMGIPMEITDLIVGLKMTAKNGLHPDLVAERFGISSGDELVRSLAFAEAPKVAIEALTDIKMLEQYGELSSDEAIAREADKAIHNDLRARMLETEANALAKATGQRKVLASAARQFAAAMISRLKVRDVKPGQYTAAEARAGKAAEKASKSGKLTEAAAEKRNQLVNNYAAKAAYQALDDVERGVRYLRKFEREGTRKAIATDYLDQIDALLERFDLRQQTNKAIDKRASLVAWMESQRAMGLEPNIPDDIANEAMRKSYKNMTVEEFRGLVDTVRQIEHLGRLKEKLLTAKDLREYQAVRDLMAKSIRDNAGNREAVTRSPTTTQERVMQTARRFGWAHIKAATLARILDGGKDGGPVWEYIVRPANEAGDREVEMRAKATEEITRILEPVFKLGKMGGKGTFFPSIGRSLNREARIAIALNTGNEGNLQRLLGGEGWTMQHIQPVLQSLTAAEWQAVQNVWDYFDSYRPEIAAKERRVYGKEPDWVEPKSFTITTADGQQVDLKGGYYPIKYDPAASQRAEEHSDADAAKRQLQGAYTSATTRRSFTKARAEEVSGRPLLYSLEGVYSGLNEVIHDLAWHEWLIDVNRLLRSNSIDSAIREHYGPEAKAQLKSWVQDVAEGDRAAANSAETALSRLRQGVSAAGLGFNVMNAMMQVTGFIPASVRIGWEWVGKGALRYLSGPIAATTEANELSSFMKNRARTRLRELNEVRNRVQDANQAFTKVNEMAYFLMLRTQQIVDTVTWWGAFEKSLAAGNNEERAISLADQAVLDSQGGGQLKDLSSVERGGPALKLFTVYYSYMNTMLNLGVAEQMSDKARGKRLANQLLIFTVAPMLGLAIKEGLTPDGDDDEWDWGALAKKMAAEQLAFLMGLMVVVREFSDAAKMVAGVAEYSRDYGGPAGLRAVSEVQKLATQINQGEVDQAFVRASVNTIGALTGLPAAQINRTIAGAEALAEDKTDNPAALLLGVQK